ncbi:Transcription initiation factor IIA large subunit-like protein [Elsinoe fawcettii]|nr:Transcription initiation factor IIA large subunit-like protein [Elsinoe fawcettii]
MSNIVAGEIFEKVIEEVVAASMTDFEENGVPQQTLNELKQTWQQKLSVRNVAQMPWDPKPAPPQQVQAPAASTQSYAAPPQAHASNGPRIKNEPGTENYNNGSYMPQAMNPELAQQRAASLLQQQYGNQASASLGAMRQNGIALPGQQQQKPSGLQLPPSNPQALQQQYQHQLKQQQAAQQPRIKAETDGASDDFQANKRARLAYAQTDGADDGMEEWKAMLNAARSVSDEDRAKNDAAMREQVAEMARELENGLMQPLTNRGRRNKNATQAATQERFTIPQLDGDFSDDDKVKDEDDENAINSDLDDSGDDANNAEEDDDDIDSMLCTYDKVQRVKNKWKCTLKDGVLSANGKEYLFHKAQGEFEW